MKEVNEVNAVNEVKEVTNFNWLLDESCGFEQILYRSGKQVDNADERVIVSISPGPAFGGLEDAVECFNPGIAVA